MDAIRLGSLLNPQGYGEFYGFYDLAQHTCALGAAADAIGTTFIDEVDVVHVWPWIQTVQVSCPAGTLCVDHVSPVTELIPHLNDDHRWTRERIADWVERLETSAGLKRAHGGSTEIIDARAPSLNPPHGGDREKDVALV